MAVKDEAVMVMRYPKPSNPQMVSGGVGFIIVRDKKHELEANSNS